MLVRTMLFHIARMGLPWLKSTTRRFGVGSSIEGSSCCSISRRQKRADKLWNWIRPALDDYPGLTPYSLRKWPSQRTANATSSSVALLLRSNGSMTGPMESVYLAAK